MWVSLLQGISIKAVCLLQGMFVIEVSIMGDIYFKGCLLYGLSLIGKFFLGFFVLYKVSLLWVFIIRVAYYWGCLLKGMTTIVISFIGRFLFQGMVIDAYVYISTCLFYLVSIQRCSDGAEGARRSGAVLQVYIQSANNLFFFSFSCNNQQVNE